MPPRRPTPSPSAPHPALPSPELLLDWTRLHGAAAIADRLLPPPLLATIVAIELPVLPELWTMRTPRADDRVFWGVNLVLDLTVGVAPTADADHADEVAREFLETTTESYAIATGVHALTLARRAVFSATWQISSRELRDLRVEHVRPLAL